MVQLGATRCKAGVQSGNDIGDWRVKWTVTMTSTVRALPSARPP
jgi:hypothetical protein